MNRILSGISLLALTAVIISANGLYAGVMTEIDFYPFVVFVLEHNQKDNGCGGAIISDFHVLSSCQCFSAEDNIKIRKHAQEYVICALCNDLYQNPVNFPVQDIMLHPECSAREIIYDYNLAVIRVKDSFDALKTVAPINLPQRNILDDLHIYISMNASFIIVGYGQYGAKDGGLGPMEAEVKLSYWEDCHQFFNLHNLDSSAKDKLCINVLSTNVSACENDDGDPVFIQPYLWGIVSTYSYVHKCTKSQLSIVTRIDTSIDWIEWCMNNAPSTSYTLFNSSVLLMFTFLTTNK